MTASARYRIPDEPTGARSVRFVFDPMWPLLATMFGGVWLGYPWFALNSIALGSPTRTSELTVLALGAAALLGGVLMLSQALSAGLVPAAWAPYLLIALVCVRLGVAYRIYQQQATPFSLWEYYGGTAANGLMVLIIGGIVVRNLIGGLTGIDVLKLAFG